MLHTQLGSTVEFIEARPYNSEHIQTFLLAPISLFILSTVGRLPVIKVSF